MSLDVSLIVDGVPCEHCGATGRRTKIVFDANITHNLGKMATEAGIYQACWRPEEIGITKAGQLIPLLTEGLKALKERPDYFIQFDSPNGWGKYVDFVPWLEEYLQACINNPDANVSVSR